MLSQLAAITLILNGFATESTLTPFQSDGCSWFLNRSPVSSADWCHCCVEHDLAYWRGGTEQQRQQADLTLYHCVLTETEDASFADLMYRGVRLGGKPSLNTSYRWGFGWSDGRQYQALTELESAEADRLEAEYLAKEPSAVCD